MQESSEQTRAGGSTVPTELAERLMRRATEPLGVIDMRPAEKLHARGSEWIAQRFSLLQQISARHGLAETPLPAPAVPLPRPTDESAAAADDGAASPGEPVPLPVSSSAANLTTALKESPQSSSLQHSSVAAAPVMERAPAPPASLSAQAKGVVGAQTPAPIASAPVISSVRAEMSLQRKLSNDAGQRAAQSVPVQPTAGWVGSCDAHPGPVSEMPLQRKSSSTINPEAAISELPLSNTSGGPPSAPAFAAPGAETSAAVRVYEMSGRNPSTAKGAIGTNATGLPLIQRSAIKPAPAKGASTIAVQELMTHAGGSPADPLHVSAEKRPESKPPALTVREQYRPQAVPASPLIMRRVESPAYATNSGALAPSFSLMTQAGPQVMRAIESAPEPQAASFGAPEPNRADVAEIADRVSRLLARQLEVSRERRGRLR